MVGVIHHGPGHERQIVDRPVREARRDPRGRLRLTTGEATYVLERHGTVNVEPEAADTGPRLPFTLTRGALLAGSTLTMLLVASRFQVSFSNNRNSKLPPAAGAANVSVALLDPLDGVVVEPSRY